MKICKLTEAYLEKLVPVIEEYRKHCGFKPSPSEIKAFITQLLENETHVLFIAIDEENDHVMGFVNLYPSFSTLAMKRIWILNGLGVSSKYRGLGIAKKLITTVKDFCTETDAIRFELKTEADNIGARKLYQNMGFTIDENHVYYRVSA